MRPRYCFVVITLAVVTALLAGVGGASFVWSQRGDTQATMRGIFSALTTAYRFSANPEDFEAPANHSQIAAALQSLTNAADALEQHGAGLDPSFGYLRRSLALDAHQALDRFENAQYAGSRFVLVKMTENCMTCHSRVHSEGSFDLGAQFLKETGVEELPPIERVSIEVATRQFETAEKTYREIFQSPNLSPRLLALGNTFEGYLRLCLGALGDTQRAVRTFEGYIKRDDMTESLRQSIEGWISALKKLDLDAARGKELQTAKTLISGAEVEKRFVSDRRSLVDFIAAEVLLHRLLRENPPSGETLAEVYYMLAVAESHVSRSYWISETPFLLEQTIRSAPRTALAEKAYSFLEDYTVAAYTGSQLPDDVEKNLEELRKLSEK